MMQTKNLRGECQNCGGAMEFEADAVGTTAACPHCGQPTELMLALPAEAASPLRTKAIVFSVIALVILLGGVGGTMLALKRAQRISQRQDGVLTVATNAPTAQAVNPFAALGFRVSSVTLESGKGRSSSLVFATGTIINLTNRERFAVRIDLDTLDANTNKVGVATDYCATLAPGAVWQFRALVVDKKAVSAVVVSITENK